MLGVLRILALLAVFFFFICLQYNRSKSDLEPSFDRYQPCSIQIEKKSDLQNETASAEIIDIPENAEVIQQIDSDEVSQQDSKN